VVKIFGLGTLFLILIVIAHISIGVFFGKTQTSNAGVGLSALTAGLAAGTVYNPYFWVSVVVAYGAAIWIVKR
jgi:hypothetical protein